MGDEVEENISEKEEWSLGLKFLMGRRQWGRGFEQGIQKTGGCCLCSRQWECCGSCWWVLLVGTYVSSLPIAERPRHQLIKREG